MPGLLGLALPWLLAFTPPTTSLRVEVAFPEGVEAGPYQAEFECPEQSAVWVELDVEGVVMVQGPSGAMCTLMIKGDTQWLLAVVELGTHSFEHAQARPMPYGPEQDLFGETEARRATPRQARTDAVPAGISLAGTTSREFTSTVESSAVITLGGVNVGLSSGGWAGPTPSKPFQPGTLTAGAVDDLARRRSFERFAADSASTLPEFGSRWAAVEVVDQRGRPVRGVKVEVTGDGGSVVLRTRSDGHAVVLQDWDGLGRLHNLRARVDQGPTIRLREGRTVTGSVRRVVEPLHKVDLALVLDTTGSMADELSYLQTELRAILETLHTQYNGLDLRFALIVYRDTGDAYTVRGLDFTSDFEAFEEALAGQTAQGGGDGPEAVHTAFESAVELGWRTPTQAARVLVHVADAPPHADQVRPALQAIDALRKQGTAIYPIAASGTDEAAEFFMRAAALMTAGQYVFLTNDSGYGGDHREATQACFDITTLADVLSAILTSQLEASRAKLPKGFDSRCNPNRGVGSYRRPPRASGVQDYLGRSLMDDDAAARHFHTPYVRTRR